MEWWQWVLLLMVWLVCSLLSGVVWALGHRERRPARPHCPGCAAYGQKAAAVQAPPVVRMINPVPKAPRK